ncbi:MAG TPA: site-specific DNA-methyltransferase [Pyrinomonadaceae bacterium]|nr:site-specific DNA-methyltransferase [Pyrinomonadaceae bacterium]
MVTFKKADPKSAKSKSKPKAELNPGDGKPIEQYTHKGKDRVNNPPVGLVTPDTDKDMGKKTYSYDPHLDPTLIWAGKAEHTSFEVPTVSLHVHERIDPRRIIEVVQKRDETPQASQGSLFESKEENPPLRQAIEFYQHRHNWSNRLIAGDSLLVMNSLLEKEGMAGHVQMVYIDPPYGISYGSNFQPFVNKRDVKDGKDDDLTNEPETIKAFRDTWELGIHSYLAYLRDRLLLARELLHDSGSVFVQISDENVHLVRNLMDEVFGAQNFCSQIAFRTSGSLSSDVVSGIYDILVWYSKDSKLVKINPLFIERDLGSYQWVELPNGTRKQVNKLTEIPKKSKYFTTENLVSSGYTATCIFPIEFDGTVYNPTSGKSWKTTKGGIEKLKAVRRLSASGKTIRYVLFYDDYPVMRLTNLWTDLAGASDKVYVVQTSPKVIQRCLLMTTEPGDLVFDPTCGSGTTAVVAEQWGRRWITCDTSRVATTLARQRLITSIFDYYHLARSEEGIGSGLKYKTVPHVTLGSIANNEPAPHETLYDQPLVDSSKLRVSGPFTVEAVPAPSVKSLEEIEPEQEKAQADTSVARSGETLRQAEWRDELFKTGIRGKGGQKISFSRVEPLPGTRWLHADAETIQSDEQPAQRVAVSFGPEHQSLEQRQVALALEEAQQLIPKPKIVVFAAFEFDPEAAKDIDETDWPGVTMLKAKMNGDLLTEDLRKKRSSNESFWLVGQPDVQITKQDDQYIVEVFGFDYYNTRTGTVESGGAHNIAMWMLDPDYDGRSIFPRQVFFPMAGEKDGWSRLAKNLRAEIDEELIQQYHGTKSLPFNAGERRRAAVKIVDDRGIESLKLIDLD